MSDKSPCVLHPNEIFCACRGGVPEQGLGEIQRFADWLKAAFPRGILWAEQGPYSAAQMILGALERPCPALPPEKPHAFCVQCGFAQMDTTRVLDGQTISAPWQVDQCGAAWSDVYNAANSVCANWLTEGHATPALSRHLQTLSTALMILDQKRVTTPTPMDGDTFTWKERADKAEAELERLRGAALPPQTGNPPPDAQFGIAIAHALRDAVFCEDGYEGGDALMWEVARRYRLRPAMVEHDESANCPLTGKHAFSECDSDLRNLVFEACAGESMSAAREQLAASCPICQAVPGQACCSNGAGEKYVHVERRVSSLRAPQSGPDAK